VVVRHARRVSGITGLSLNSLDVLSGLETVKICTAYQLDGKTIESYPASLELLSRCEPIYEEMPGWNEDLSNVKSLDELPANARHYVERVSQLTGVPISIFSVGRNREQTNLVRPIYV